MTATFVSRLRRWWTNVNKSTKPAREVHLTLETLEKRTVPSAAPGLNLQPVPNDTFLATIYQGELGRPIDSAGLSYWDGQLNQRASRTAVVDGILSSNEYLNRVVTLDYISLLGRLPDAGGLAYWSAKLQQGDTPQDVKASIMGSDEFFSRVGGDANSYLNAVYNSSLGRPVDAAGVAYWGPQVNDVASRTQIALAIENSPEGSNLAVATIYQDTLGRTPDAGGLAYWSGQLQQNVSQTSVLTGVLGSDEFFSRMQSYVSQVNTNDPNVAAATFIAQAQLFKSRPYLVPAGMNGGGMGTTGDNSPNPPTGDHITSDGDVLGQPNNRVIDITGIGYWQLYFNNVVPPAVDTSTTDTSVTDTSGTDTSGGTDCGCDGFVIDTSGGDNSDNTSYPVDPGTGQDTSDSSVDTSSVDASVDPTVGF
jgi:Domain of unknown function (DUF4214)